MKVSIIANALAGLGSAKVGALADEAWRGVRPHDELHVTISSDGVRLPSSGTGLVEVFTQSHSGARVHECSEPRRMICVDESAAEALIDLAEALGEPELEGIFGSTAFLGADVLGLLDDGIRRIHLHLPQIMSHTDVGIGLLGVLSGQDLNWDSAAEQLASAIAQARRRLGSASIVFTYPADLALTGVSGLARKLDASGFPQIEAQNLERQLGELVARLSPASTNIGSSLFGSIHRGAAHPHAVFAGVGGGLGYLLSLLGASASTVGQYLHASRPATEPDLYIYITDHIGLDFPSGLEAVASDALDRGAPVVVILREGNMRRGELPRYGIHGTYQLKTNGVLHLTDGYFASGDVDVSTLASVPDALSSSIVSVANTWGWD